MILRKPLHFAVAAIFAGVSSLAAAGPSPKPFDIEVTPWTFDPAHTNLVSSQWVEGSGCPTLTKTLLFTPPNYDNASLTPGTYADAGCPTAGEDKKIQGLLLGKTGPTANNASGGASIDKVKGITLTELGYDIRHGSHCGFGSPRFNIVTTTGKFYFLGCGSPAPVVNASGADWDRLRWGNGAAGSVQAYLNGQTLESITDPIKSIDIVFDEGTDQGTGLAILDNIDVNGLLEGEGKGEHKGEGK